MPDYARMKSPTGSVQDIPTAYIRDRQAMGWVVCPEADPRPFLHGSTVNRHLGRDALVIASGPSAGSVPVDRLRAWADAAGLVTWVTNNAHSICGGSPFPRADYLAILDDNFWFTRREKLAAYLHANPLCVPVLGFDPGDCALSYQRVVVDMNRTPNTAPAYVPNEYFHGNSTGIVACQMALHCGCRSIWLLGHDCKTIGGKTHGDGVRCAEELSNGYKQGRDMLAGYATLAAHAAALGVRITNLSRDSAVECFPRATFEDVESRTSRRKDTR